MPQHVSVAFQGESGAFSDEAARALLGHISTVGLHSFEDVVHAVASGEVLYGLLPCENTIAGAITRTYDLLYENQSVKIIGEGTHRIEQCLIGLPSATLSDVSSVISHPVALEQCRRFFAKYSQIASAVAPDTAGAVRTVIEKSNRSIAAIGPALCAERYGGRILQRGIQDDENNYTRFFLVSASLAAPRLTGKMCLAVNLPHTAGSLYKALQIFAEKGLNLRSLVARPLRGKPFQYTFYLEIANAYDAGIATAIKRAIVLGHY